MGVGDVVRSLKGRDAGKLFFVLAEDPDGYVWLADGRLRRLEHPKRKKLKHTEEADALRCEVSAKVKAGQKVRNRELREALAEREGNHNGQG